ncbi:FxSxx-COOH system tetratricopeptide repeat protein, partial [Actinoplanes nipponensis]
MSATSPAGPVASGPGSAAVGTNTGITNTGANPRFVTVGSGGLPLPDQVAMPSRLDNLIKPPTDPFVGRAETLQALEEALTADHTSVVTQAVYGLGGVGKSELALQYAANHRDRYRLVWWIVADEPERLDAGLAELAHRLNPTLALVEAKTADAATWAVQWLQSHPGWLLVLDNVDNRQHINGLLGRVGGRGHVIITTRRNISWRGAARTLSLDILSADAAIELLEELTGRDEPVAAKALAAQLGHLPLALDQAGAYIAQQHISLSAYLQLLRQRPAEAFATVAETDESARAVARVWQVTLDAIAQRDPLAVLLLQVISYCAPDNIPRDMLTALDPDHVDQALGVLASYSMITLTEDAVSVHRLVQAVLRTHSTPAPDGHNELQPPAVVTALLAAACPNGNIQTAIEDWPRWRTLNPHIDAFARCTSDEQANEAHASLFSNSALFSWTQGQHHIALPLQQRALTITETAVGPDHPTVAIRLNNLAQTLHALGRASEALPLQQRALTITETALGADHPDVAIRLDNLAGTLQALGRAGEALPLQQRALTISQAALGADHPDVAIGLDNLAGTLYALGRTAEALPLQQRALTISQAALGPDHPTAAIRLDNLAQTLRALGRAG